MEGHIRMYLKEIGINARNWVDSAQERNYWWVLVNVVPYAIEIVTFIIFIPEGNRILISTDTDLLSTEKGER